MFLARHSFLRDLIPLTAFSGTPSMIHQPLCSTAMIGSNPRLSSVHHPSIPTGMLARFPRRFRVEQIFMPPRDCPCRAARDRAPLHPARSRSQLRRAVISASDPASAIQHAANLIGPARSIALGREALGRCVVPARNVITKSHAALLPGLHRAR
jgi:hypothetical protein